MTLLTYVGVYLDVFGVFNQMQLLAHMLWWKVCSWSWWYLRIWLLPCPWSRWPRDHLDCVMQAMQLEGERKDQALKEADELHKKVFKDTHSVGVCQLACCLSCFGDLGCEVFECTQVMCGYLADVIKAARRWRSNLFLCDPRACRLSNPCCHIKTLAPLFAHHQQACLRVIY